MQQWGYHANLTLKNHASRLQAQEPRKVEEYRAAGGMHNGKKKKTQNRLIQGYEDEKDNLVGEGGRNQSRRMVVIDVHCQELGMSI